MTSTRRSPALVTPGPENNAHDDEFAADLTQAGHLSDDVCADPHAARSLNRFMIRLTLEVGR